MNWIVVDPNSTSRRFPGLSVAGFTDALFIPVRGDVVQVHQPDENGSDYVGTGTVIDVDGTHGLIYLDVDWSSFVEMPA